MRRRFEKQNWVCSPSDRSAQCYAEEVEMANKEKLNNRKKTTLLFVTFGHRQLKSKPSENHSTKSISFRLSLRLSTPSANRTNRFSLYYP